MDADPDRVAVLIRRVTAHAFGPLRDETLEFADGLNVVYGRNESAKSSWHAAIFAALCGRRRGAGSTTEDRQFTDRHKPWDRDGWVVSAEVRLADGRRVELRHDLDRRVNCHAKDLDVGTDYSAEIMNDGTPDGAKWLGLDRTSFAATALVRQAQMLAVLDGAGGLQTYLQQAAATAGEATAARALSRIDAFRTDHVGGERSRSRPLPRAFDEGHVARAEVDRARARYVEYEQRLVAVQKLRVGADAAERLLHLHEAAGLHARAVEARARADEATALRARLPDTEPASAAADASAVQAVADALAAWRSAQAADGVSGPPGRTAGSAGSDPVTMAVRDDEVRDGDVRDGDVRDGDVRDGDVRDGEVGDEELWELARVLDLPKPTPDKRATAEREEARAAVGRARRLRLTGVWSLFLGFTAAGLGAVPFTAGEPTVAVVVLVFGLVIATGGTVQWRRSRLPAAQLALASAGAVVAAEDGAARYWRERHAAAVQRCTALRQRPDPDSLRDVVRARAGNSRDRAWSARAVAERARAGGLAMATAQLLGLPPGTPAEAVEALTQWQDGRAVTAADADRDRRDRARLAGLLDGGSVTTLVDAAHADQQRVDRSGVSVDDLRQVAAYDADYVAVLRKEASEATERAAMAAGSLTERRGSLPDVAAAEERLAAAEEHADRLRELDTTLVRTRAFLVAAQDRAYRDIAPVLAESVRRRLPAVTGGRYTDVIVDPADLRVQVCGPDRRWRRAELLSHGTAEQVYLLLRLALCDHLVRPGESCPLILDDAVVHADPERSAELLELLHSAAADRQIVLFTHQTPVRDWALRHLVGDEHAVRELTPVAAA